MKALNFRSLPVEFKLIHEMGRVFQRLIATGYTEQEALYFAYVETHRNPHGIATACGAQEFYRRMVEYLRTAMDMVEYVIAMYLRPYAERLPAHNSVANCLDPIVMLKMATSDPGSNAASLEKRRHFEAQRQLGIAMQLFAIESADEEARVAHDLSEIDRLTWERLFDPARSENLWLVAELDSTRANRSQRLELVSTHRQAKRVAKQRRGNGQAAKEELLPCRVAPKGEMRYLIYVVNRRKRLLATLLKLERGRPTDDRRGWKYVIVAVIERRKKMRLALREDACVFHEYTHQVLWQPPLMKMTVENVPNPHRHATYWDLKTVGRFHWIEDGRTVAGAAEQLVTTIQDHLDTQIAHDGLNHDLYRAAQVVECLAPLWFPHRHGPFEESALVRLPGFGVDWNAHHYREQLERWLMSQL